MTIFIQPLVTPAQAGVQETRENDNRGCFVQLAVQSSISATKNEPNRVSLLFRSPKHTVSPPAARALCGFFVSPKYS